MNNHLNRAGSISRNEALTLGTRSDEMIPLVLTYHPFNSRITKILLDNFVILSSDQDTRPIFPRRHIVSFRRDRNLRNMLVHTHDQCRTDQPGTFACLHPRCRTGQYTTSNVHLHGPKGSTTIRERFTCRSENLVYCIFCRRCAHERYIGETGRSLRERFGEQLRNVQKNTPGFPVAEHFNSVGHSLSDMVVRLCTGSNLRRKQLEMEIIFRLGSFQPLGLNNVFHFL